jgi:hypothetical protein
MRPVSCDLVFVQGKGLDDLNERLRANPRFVFRIEKRKRGREGWAVWRHKQQVTHRGDVKLIQSGGKFRGEIKDRSNGMLAGAFLGWLLRNAEDLVYRIEFRIE